MMKLYLDEDVPEAIAILSKQLPIGVIVKALLRLLSNIPYEKSRNNVIWLSDWIT